MTIEPGQTLLHYRIVEKIGEGGMGAVWLARDTTLDRDVAIKVLPEAFASDPERMARFEREAKLLASLNHPNIAAIHGLHDAGGRVPFIAMENVPGEDLAERLAARGALPMDEALEIARKVAVGMAAAHDGGTIHRDLKPANVRITPAGEVKVLDFGLARAADTAAEGDPDRSPTITSAGTRAGMLMGTAAYMSPEQARGRAVDRRADVWAWGCLLYECLTGARAFPGETISDILAEVLKTEPDWSRLPANTPASVRRLLRRCLAKSPGDRLRDLGDAALVLADAEAGDGDDDVPSAAAVAALAGPTGGLSRGRMASLIIVGIILGAAAGVWWSGRGDGAGATGVSTGNVPITAGVVPLPGDAGIAFGAAEIGYDSPMLTISADGAHVVYVGRHGDGSRLYHQDLSTFDPPRPIPGTEGALEAHFSPHELSVAFFTDDTLKRVDLNGDRLQSLGDVNAATRLVWSDDGNIYVGDNQAGEIVRVPEDGGPAEKLMELPYHGMSDILPGGGGILYHHKTRNLRCDYGRVLVRDFETGTETETDRVVLENAFDARVVGDHLVFMRGTTLMAAPFDVGSAEVTGEEVLLVRDVAVDSIFGQAQLAFAANGTLAFLPGGDRSVGVIAWVDRDGQRGTLPVDPRVYGVLRLDPDDRRLAVHVGDVEDYIWIYDLERGTGRELPSQHSSGWPIWNSAGDAVTYLEMQDTFRLLEQKVDERVPPRELATADEYMVAYDWSPGDRYFVYRRGGDRHVIDRDGKPVGEPHASSMARFSPDGRWMSYGYRQSGVYEILVQSWPDGERVYTIQSEGGIEGVWSRNGELFYRIGDRWFAAQMTFGDELTWTTPELAFEIPFLDTPGTSYDVTSDGGRMYTIIQAEEDIEDRIHVLRGIL